MSWKRAKIIADRYIAHLGLPPRLDGARVTLTDYADEATHSLLKPGLQWGLDFERMVTRACQRELIRRGAEVKIEVVRLEEYQAWLKEAGRTNDAGSRAAYAAMRSKWE